MARPNIPNLVPSSDLFYAYGTILGDGTIENDGRYGAKLGVTSKIFANSFEQSLNRLGLRTHSWSQKQKNGSGKIHTIYYIKTYGKIFFLWLKSNPKIPKDFYLDFIRGFFEAEGCNALEGSNQVKFYNTDQALIMMVKDMIEDLGYSCNAIKQKQLGFGSLPIHTLYLLGGKQAGLNFITELNPCIKRN